MEENGELGVDGPIDGEFLGDLLYISDNFMVIAEEGNDEDVDFYILQCQKPKYVVQETFTCSWGGVTTLALGS
jgi:hypothetical protein